MNKLSTFIVLAFVIAGSFFSVTKAQAHSSCILVDPIQGMVNVTCKNAQLNVSGNGVRSLPHPSSLKRGTEVSIVWVSPFSGNTLVSSWDSVGQTTHFWQRVNRVWTRIPANAFMQENGAHPRAHIEVMRMPNGESGWAITEMQDLMVWNGGN